jgi:hypothetical protein
MSNAPDFDDDGIEHLDFEDPAIARAAERAKALAKTKPHKRNAIPVLPPSPIPIEEIRGNPGRRSRACVNLRIERVPWHEVVRLLEYDTIEQARADYLRAIASMHQPEEAETMRAATIENAEQLLRRSMAMASADYLVDAEHPEKKIPNRDRLRWHAQAGADLNMLATLQGVKAPIRVEVTPTEEQYAMLTAAVLQARGVDPVIEAEVLELEEIPAEPDED